MVKAGAPVETPAEQLDEGARLPLLLVETLQRGVDRGVFGAKLVDRLEVNDRALGAGREVLRREGRLVEQIGVGARVDRRGDSAVVDAKELVPPSLGAEHQFDAIDRPPCARRELEQPLEGFDEQRRGRAVLTLEGNHALHQRLGEHGVHGAFDERAVVRPRDDLPCPTSRATVSAACQRSSRPGSRSPRRRPLAGPRRGPR